MPEWLDFVTYDVFTDTRFAGNPLAIVLSANDLSDQQMQTIAREFNLSETIFVQTPMDPSHRAQVRIFFPTAEIPFAGHPTIGCAIYLATLDRPAGDFDVTLVLEEQAGLVPVQVTRTADKLRAEFVAPILPFQPDQGQVPDIDLICAATGLRPDQIVTDRLKPGLGQGGPSFLYVPVVDAAALAQVRAYEPAWSQMMDGAAVDSGYFYVLQDKNHVRARMLAPTAGIPEDPATGSAAAILSDQLLRAGLLQDGENSFTILQGVEMGRPSDIGMRSIVSANKLNSVHISGTAVHVMSGQLQYPTSAQSRT